MPAQLRCGRLQHELAGSRRAREQADTQCAKEQRASAESAKQLKELEDNLSERAAELEQTKGEFEKRINEIYQNCRSTEDITAAFDKLQKELEEKIG